MAKYQFEDAEITRLEEKGLICVEFEEDYYVTHTYVFTEAMKNENCFVCIRRELPRTEVNEDDEEVEIEFDSELNVELFWLENEVSYRFNLYSATDPETPLLEFEKQILDAINLMEIEKSQRLEILRRVSLNTSVSAEIKDPLLANLAYKMVKQMVEKVDAYFRPWGH